ncbi:MAG TPA: TIM barrel protein [Candidatus Paceibacterota bacterium]|nr:sugar phosphate isomerase/epimerase [Verrucomicrobiota bacterium]HOX03360.1 TIM barrel protein [Verrucomicrobiota bacterium]HRZ46280.1 TIM barrel protein [Candidatus Paceibacterota bacterium]HRZ93353.1 TIM barrel protein [Candidatus Paceibacterota bacterium]
MKRISIGTWAFVFNQKRPIEFSEIVTGLKKLHFDGLELGGFGIHPNPTTGWTAASWQRDPAAAYRDLCAAIRSTWESQGLGCSGLAADLWAERLITAPDNNSYLAAFRKNLEFCELLGIDVIRVDTTEPPGILGKIPGEKPPADRPTVPYETAFKRVVSTWKRCAREAADRGVRIVWEFEPGYAFNKPSDIFRVVDAVNHDQFMVMFDTCHADNVAVNGARQPGKKETLPGGIRELAEKLAGKIGRVHLIDSNGTLNEHGTSAHPPFGQGRLKFDEFMPALVAAGCPDDWWTIDLCFWPDAWKSTAKCKKAIDQLNKKYG